MPPNFAPTSRIFASTNRAAVSGEISHIVDALASALLILTSCFVEPRARAGAVERLVSEPLAFRTSAAAARAESTARRHAGLAAITARALRGRLGEAKQAHVVGQLHADPQNTSQG